MKKYDNFNALKELLPPRYKKTTIRGKSPKATSTTKVGVVTNVYTDFNSPYANYLAMWENLFEAQPKTASADYIDDHKESLIKAYPHNEQLIKMFNPRRRRICRWVMKQMEADVNLPYAPGFLFALINAYKKDSEGDCELVFDNEGGVSVIRIPKTGIRIFEDSGITHIQL